MRFGLVHRIMTDTLAALGVLALVTSSPFSRSMMIAILTALGAAIAMREPWRQEASDRHVDTISVVVLTAVQVARLMMTQASGLDLIIQFAVGLQIIRVATRKGAAHDQQVIVLALLHLIAGMVVGGGLGYGLCFFGLLVVTPGALVLSHLRREVEGNYRQGARDRTGLPVDVPRILRSKRVVGKQFILVTCLLSLPILMFTVALFVVFPRVGLSLLLLNRRIGDRMIGFSDTVDLGQIGTLRNDPTIALRITIDGLPDAPPDRLILHLRGTALDRYDGRTWTQSRKFQRHIASAGDLLVLSTPPDVSRDPKMHLELEPIDPPVLFLPRLTRGMRVIRDTTPPARIVRGPEGELRYQSSSGRGARYDVFMSRRQRVTFRHLPDHARDRHLQLPADLSQRIRDLAFQWTRDTENELAKIDSIEQKLRSRYSYDLDSPSGLAKAPLDHFLFTSKRGHCEYFSTAMAIMLRTIDIPTRNVTGFIGGSYNKFGEFYAVRQGDAHSWVEAYVAGRGWMTFDPTPPSAAVPYSDIDGVLASVRDLFEAVSQRWNHHVLGYDLRQQIGMFEDRKSTRLNSSH
jgi:transglutaminase-like putative cysteine protease